MRLEARHGQDGQLAAWGGHLVQVVRPGWSGLSRRRSPVEDNGRYRNRTFAILIPEAQRILVYRLGSLGDTCVALPALRIVRQSFPQARIVLLTNIPVNLKAAPAVSVLADMGLVDDYLAYPVGTRNPVTLGRLALRLRRGRFEAVVNLTAWRGVSALRRDAFFFRLCGIRHQIGFEANKDGGSRVDGMGRREPEAERLLRRVAELGCADLSERRWYDLDLKSGENQQAESVLRSAGIESPFLAFSVGTKVPVNDWEQERWVQLFAILGGRHDRLGCVAIGAKDEIGRAEDCLKAWRGPKLNLCGQLAPRASAAVLARATAFIGHDSGPMHLAAAVGTPCVAIFSARNLPGQWFPLGEGHEVLYRRVECAGCGLEECSIEQKRCIRGISVDEVAAVVQRQIERSGLTHQPDC
jgi:heptosyltransferase III